MYEFHPYITADGSIGLYNPDFNDIYHSATGALTEAYEKFIYPINFNNLLEKDSINVLDICYGIGYNSKSFLNYFYENFLKKNKKNNFIKNTHIDTIHTDKNHIPKESINTETIYTNNKSCNILNNDVKECKPSTLYNGTIHTNKNCPNKPPKISIKAIDTDMILGYLSPFIRTGIKNIPNQDLDFEYNKIDKFLNSNNKTLEHLKINNLINYYLLCAISEKYPDIYENKIINTILKSDKFKQYFDPQMLHFYKFNQIDRCKYSSPNNLFAFLHNIYYRHVSRSYKNRLKAYNLQEIDFCLEIGDARKIILADTQKYDLIFLDAFTPSKCPCLWSLEFFKLLYSHLNDSGQIFTYSSAPSIRTAMLEAGFYIGEIFNQRENKFIGTIAVKDKSLIKYDLSEFDLGLLKTKAGIFYRDYNLSSQNEAIIEARNLEVKSSNKMSISHYKKIHKEDKCNMM